MDELLYLDANGGWAMTPEALVDTLRKGTPDDGKPATATIRLFKREGQLIIDYCEITSPK